MKALKKAQRQKKKAMKAQKRRKRAMKAEAGRQSNARSIMGESGYNPVNMVVTGEFNEWGYGQVNGCEEGEGFDHFVDGGFTDGCPVVVQNESGVFVGIFNGSGYFENNGLDEPDLSEHYTPGAAAFNHLTEEGGRDDGMMIVISPAAPIAVFGSWNDDFYISSNPGCVAYTTKPRPGKFDKKGYLALHEDVAEEGEDAFEHFARHGFKEGREIVVNGRQGPFNKKWYKRKHGCRKIKKHLKNVGEERDWKPMKMKVKGPILSPFEHYATYAHENGHNLRLQNMAGIFEGVFDADAYLQMNPDCEDDPFDALNGAMEEGEGSIALSSVTAIMIYPSDLEELPEYAGDEEEEDSDEEDEDEDEEEEEEEEDSDED